MGRFLTLLRYLGNSEKQNLGQKHSYMGFLFVQKSMTVNDLEQPKRIYNNR